MAMGIRAGVCMALLMGASSWVSAMGVNVKHIMIDSQVMKFPAISLDGINYESLIFEYGTQGTVEVVKAHPMTESLKCGESHYLKLDYTGPEVVFRILDKSRNKVLLKNDLDTSGSVEYGRGECHSASAVESDFMKNKSAWQRELNKQVLSGARKKMELYIDENTALGYEDIRFPLFFISANGSRFTELNQAFDKARDAFDLYTQFGVTIDAQATLREVAATWEQQLEEMMNDSDSGVEDDPIKLVLHRNLSITYLFLTQFDQSRRHDALATSKGMEAGQTIQPVILKHERRYILSPVVANNLVLMANLYRFGTNVIREARLEESDFKAVTANL